MGTSPTIFTVISPNEETVVCSADAVSAFLPQIHYHSGMENPPYTPIDCNFYDILEAKATLREVIRLGFLPQAGEAEEEVETVIKDLYSREKIEYMLTREGMELRLDRITRINDLEAPDSPSCSI